MLSMKKQVAILAIVPLFLASYIFMALTPMALAIHTSQVQWEACSQKPFVKGPDGIHMWSQAWLGSVANPEHVNFTVTNVKGSPDRITKVEVFFDMNETAPSVGFCYFHFVGGSVHDETGGPARNWTVSVLEIDPRGWPRVLIFETPNAQNGIFDDRTFTFKLDLAEGPSQCDYDFIITTVDEMAYSPTSSVLLLTLDNTPPNVPSTTPIKGQHVEGIGFACGPQAHYMLLDVELRDGPKPHETGLLDVTIIVDKDTVYSKHYTINYAPGKTWTMSNEVPKSDRQVWNLADGDHSLNVTVCDRVGNYRTETIPFTYEAPPRPLTISPQTGYASLITNIKDPVTGLVGSQHKEYKEKEFGTQITVNGKPVGDLHWGKNVDVTITVYIPTYHSYFATYGSYEVLVAKTKTASDETFTTTFTFPKAPLGKYRITARSTEMDCDVYFEVLPQVIFEPNEVIGPALINVEATGFISVPVYEWPETWTIYVLCNNKDTLQGVNEQVFNNWYIDGNGTLQNIITYQTGHFTENGLYWPALQPGTYEVTLFVATSGSYLNIVEEEPRINFEHGNTITVVSTLDLLPKIYDKIVEIDGNVVDILTEVGLIEIKLDDLKPVVTRIDGNVAYIKTTVENIEGIVTSINGTTTVIETVVGDIAVNTSKIIDLLPPAGPDLTLTLNIATVLSAVAAIAAIIAAAVVTKRLKVAA